MSMSGQARRRLSSALSILLIAAACSEEITTKPVTRNFTPSLSRIATPVEGRHLFVLNGNIPADFASRVATKGGSVVRMLPEISAVITAGLSDADAADLGGKNNVAPDVTARWVPTPEEMQVSTTSLMPPADATSLFPPQAAAFGPFQWNMRQIDAPKAWVNHTGIPSVRVAILDTGLDPDHIDQHGLIDVASSIAFVPSVSGPPAWADDHFHGSHVGGIVTSNNIGVAGVAPNVTLIAVKVLDANGNGNFGDIIAGIIWAATVHAQVINMSLGAEIPKQAAYLSTLAALLNRAVNYAKSHGTLVVSSAGNRNLDLQQGHEFISLPCEAGVGMCISATGPSDTRAFYSNYGTNAINVAAPGGDGSAPPLSFVLSVCSSRTVSTDPAVATCRGNRNRYLFVAGTSQAAPHVSGLAALLDSQFGGTLNPSQLITLIQQNADDRGKPGVDAEYGKGRINVFKTVNTTQP